MKRQLSHLITGSELAILNGPSIKTPALSGLIKELDKGYVDAMYKVLKHYQEGGTIFTRPTY